MINKSTHILFSVIMPTYNRTQMITTAIDSVLNQSYHNWELIIVDDGSNDDTFKVVEVYLQRDKRIRYFHQINQGESVARNLGIRNSTGNYVCFLDDDDYYYPNFLETFANKIREEGNTPQVYMCDQYEENGQEVIKRKFYKKSFEKDQLGYLILHGNNIQNFVFPKFILFEEHFEPKFKFGEDFHFLLRILLKLPLIYIPEVLCVYRNHDNMTFSREIKGALFLSGNNRLDTLDDLIQQYEKVFLEKNVLSLFFRKYNKYCYFFAGAALRKLNLQASLGLLKRMKWQYPFFVLIYYHISILGRLPYYVLKKTIFFNKNIKA